jgi:hypothetical protein
MTSPQTARIIGMITFFVGVILLILVFVAAQADMARPMTGDAARMGVALVYKLGLLLVMGYAGSSIASRGAQLYGAANARTLAVSETSAPAEEAVARKELPSSGSS